MELRHLKYFVAVAEELHFGRAAQRVGIAQPPLSQQIKSLEGEIGAPLFFRGKRHVELTAAGAAFLPEARKTLAQAGQSIDAARRAARGETGRLSVGFVSSAFYGEFTSVFRRMRTRHPGVTFILEDLTSEEQVAAMKLRRLDAGLIRPPVPGSEEFSIEAVFDEPMMAALPQKSRLARHKQVDIKDLAGEPFLLVPRSQGPAYYDQIIQFCAHAGFAPKVAQEANSTQTIISLIAANLGVSLVPASLQNLRRNGVIYRALKPPAPETHLAVIWRPQDPSPILHSFLEIVREVAEARASA